MLIIVQEQQQHSQLDSSHFAMLSPFPSPHPLAFPGSLHLILQRQNKYGKLKPKIKNSRYQLSPVWLRTATILSMHVVEYSTFHTEHKRNIA